MEANKLLSILFGTLFLHELNFIELYMWILSEIIWGFPVQGSLYEPEDGDGMEVMANIDIDIAVDIKPPIPPSLLYKTQISCAWLNMNLNAFNEDQVYLFNLVY